MRETTPSALPSLRVVLGSPGSVGTSHPTAHKGEYAVRRKSLSLLFLLPVMVASLPLASCSSPNGPPGPTGTLTGSLQAVGGPAGVVPRALSGQITLHGPSGHIVGITVGAAGKFSVPVPVGTYIVSGQSPQYEGGSAVCRASGPVVVTKGVTSSVEVDCQEM
jgi:hypothetical protein